MATHVPPQLEDIDCKDDEGVFIDENELNDTQTHVKALVALNVEIKELSAAISQRRKQHKALNSKILGYMQANQIPHFDLAEKGKIQVATNKRKQPLNSKWIASQLKGIEGLDSDMQLRIIEALENRPVKEVTRLQHKENKAA